MNLKLYISVATGLKLKVRNIAGLNRMFVEVTREKLGTGAFLPPLPPQSSWIGLKKNPSDSDDSSDKKFNHHFFSM